MKNLLRLLGLWLAMSCSGIDENPERIDKLRAIGVDTDQASYSFAEEGQPETSATLSFLLLTKDPAPVTVALVDDGAYAPLADIAQTEEIFAEMRLVRVTAKLVIPSQAQTVLFDEDGSGLVPFALRIVQGSEEELIRSRLRIYQADDPRLALGKPTITLSTLQSKAPLPAGTIPLIADVTKTQDEAYRLSWFVAEGEIDQRRAEDAEWKDVTPGVKTVLVTIRGLDSLQFAYAVVDIAVR